MAVSRSIRELSRKVPTEPCIHCTNGWVFQPTEDTLHDEALECPICFGSGRRTGNAKRLRIRAVRDLDAQFTCLERMGP
jgi:hypothetical protein